MAIKFISKRDFDTPKMFARKDGKLVFSRQAARLLKITTGQFFLIGKDESVDAEFIIAKPKKRRSECFNVYRDSGGYYYLDTQPVLDYFGIPYRRRVVFEMKRAPMFDQETGGESYILKVNK